MQCRFLSLIKEAEMEELIELLKDGKTRSLEMIAAELGVSIEHVKRNIEFLERAGIIRKVDLNVASGNCAGCSGCSANAKAGGETDGDSDGDSVKTCPGCMPEGGFKNMGSMWEVKEGN